MEEGKLCKGPSPTDCVGAVLDANRRSCSPRWFTKMAPRMTSVQAIYILGDNIQAKGKLKGKACTPENTFSFVLI